MMVAPTMSKVAMLDLSTSLNTPMLSSFLAGIGLQNFLFLVLIDLPFEQVFTL